MKRIIAVFGACGLFLVAGCVTPPPIRPELPAQNEERLLEALCSDVRSMLEEGDFEGLQSVFNVERFRANVMFGVSSEGSTVAAGFIKGLNESLAAAPERLAESGGREWRHLRFTRTGNEAVCTLRTGIGDQGVGIVDVYLVSDGKRATMTNWLPYDGGFLASEAIRLFVVDFVNAIHALERVGFSEDSQEARTFQTLAAFLKSHNSASSHQVVLAYRALPQRYRDSEFYSFVYLKHAGVLGKELRARAFDDFANRFGRDPTFAYFLFDHYLENKQYDQALRVPELLRERIGENYVADLIEALVHMEKQDLKSFYGTASRMLDAYPEEEDIYWVLLTSFAQQGRFDDAVLVLEVLDEMFGYQFTARSMASVDGLKDLASSPEFNTWLTR